MKPSLLKTRRYDAFYLIILITSFMVRVKSEINESSNTQNIEEGSQGYAVPSTMDNWKKNCNKSYSAMCLKLDIVSMVDRLTEQDSIGILPGVSVVKQNTTTTSPSSDVVANLARNYPKDADKRVDAYLLHKIGDFLNSHSISIKLSDLKSLDGLKDDALEKLGFAEQRLDTDDDDKKTTARKKDKGGNGSMMAGLMMMKGTLGALAFGALAMLAGKALMTGLMALMLSAIVGLKSLTHGEQKTTYEIVSKPAHTIAHTHSAELEHHSGYSSGYARALSEEVVREAIVNNNKVHGNVRDRRAVRIR